MSKKDRLVGSFIGSLVGGLVYTTGYRFAISYCIDTGFTMFGLVKQDYTLPKDVLKEIGIDVFEPKTNEPERNEPERNYPVRYETVRNKLERARPFILRRGVIGVREIGYVAV